MASSDVKVSGAEVMRHATVRVTVTSPFGFFGWRWRVAKLLIYLAARILRFRLGSFTVKQSKP